MKKVSIIVPVFNAEKYLDECLQSLAGQSYRNIEVICVDDGSTDGSKTICLNWKGKDDRFLYYYQENKGVSVARNLGIDLSTGDYLCFIDADDIIHSNYVETLLAYSVNGDTAICGITRKDDLGSGDKIKFYSISHFINKVVFERIKHPGFTCFFYDKNIINNNQIRFYAGCAVNEDYEFYLKYLTCCSGRIVSLGYKGYYYRVNESSALAAPVSYKNLTSIEASRRINDCLVKKNIIADDSILLANGILIYLYAVSMQNNRELYDYLHNRYNVKKAMKKMLYFPRLKKKLVALLYLLSGPELFFKIVQKVN